MDKNDALKETFKEIPLVPIIILLGGLTLLALGLLVIYHYKLSMFNQTTYEQRKDTFTYYNQSPFEAYSIGKNLGLHIFTPKPAKPVFRPLEEFDAVKSTY